MGRGSRAFKFELENLAGDQKIPITAALLNLNEAELDAAFNASAAPETDTGKAAKTPTHVSFKDKDYEGFGAEDYRPFAGL